MGRGTLLAGTVSGLILILLAVYVIPLLTISETVHTGTSEVDSKAPITSYEPSPAQKKEILDVERTYHVVRGENSSFDISVQNPFKNSTIVGLDVTFDGPFSKYLIVEAGERTDMFGEKIEIDGLPGRIGLAYGQTQNYEIKASVPQYVERGTYFVDLEIHKGNVTYRDYPQSQTVHYRQTMGQWLQYPGCGMLPGKGRCASISLPVPGFLHSPAPSIGRQLVWHRLAVPQPPSGFRYTNGFFQQAL